MSNFTTAGFSKVKASKSVINGKQVITNAELIGTEAESNPIYWPGQTKSGISVRNYAGSLKDIAIAVCLSQSSKTSQAGPLQLTLINPDGVRIPIAGTRITSDSLAYRQPGIMGLIDSDPFELKRKGSQSFLFSEKHLNVKGINLSNTIAKSLKGKKSELSLTSLKALNGTSPNGRWQLEVQNSGNSAVKLKSWELLVKTDESNSKINDNQSEARKDFGELDSRKLHPKTTLNQAVRALDADSARVKYGVDGSGVRIGVLSNTFNSMGGAAWDYKTGVLDESLITVALERDGVQGRYAAAEDEGRAMIQNIHSIAPGAETIFYSWYDEYFNDELDSASKITDSPDQRDEAIRKAHEGYSIQQRKYREALIELATTYKCDIIVDDLDDSEPWFEDGPMAKAIEYVTNEYGVSYFSASGNSTNNSYTAEFNPKVKSDLTAEIFNELPGELQAALNEGKEAHLFEGDNGSSSLLQEIFFNTGTSMQWNSKWGDNRAQVEVMIFDKDKNFVGQGLTDPDGKNPWAFIPEPANGPKDPSYIAIVHTGWSDDTRPDLIKWIGGQYSNVATNSNLGYYTGTAVGHSNTSVSASVNSGQYWSTPAYRAKNPKVSRFGSWGVTPIYFDEAGNRLARPELRQTPMFVTPQKGNTSFFSHGYIEENDAEGDYLQNFEGTSAAAPNAAAVAALMLQYDSKLTTSELFKALKQSALPLEPVVQSTTDSRGFNNASGFGLINAMAALDHLSDTKKKDRENKIKYAEKRNRNSLQRLDSTDIITGVQIGHEYENITSSDPNANSRAFTDESLFVSEIGKKTARDRVTKYEGDITIRGDLLLRFGSEKKNPIGSHTILKGESLSGGFENITVKGLDEDLYVGIGIKGGNRFVVTVSDSIFDGSIQAGLIG